MFGKCMDIGTVVCALILGFFHISQSTLHNFQALIFFMRIHQCSHGKGFEDDSFVSKIGRTDFACVADICDIWGDKCITIKLRNS
jgi:hypothetical protein